MHALDHVGMCVCLSVCLCLHASVSMYGLVVYFRFFFQSLSTFTFWEKVSHWFDYAGQWPSGPYFLHPSSTRCHTLCLFFCGCCCCFCCCFIWVLEIWTQILRFLLWVVYQLPHFSNLKFVIFTNDNLEFILITYGVLETFSFKVQNLNVFSLKYK